MGMFSWMCAGSCQAPINEGEEVVRVQMGRYDGYGNVPGSMSDAGVFWHRFCFEQALTQLITAKITKGDSLEVFDNLTDYEERAADPNQGMGEVNPKFSGRDED